MKVRRLYNLSDKKANTGDNRSCVWATIVYPESAPENWQTIIADSHIQTLISPIHDKDVNPGGEPKKPHYHVIAKYGSKKSEEQFREYAVQFGGVGAEKVPSLRGYSRYLCHLDNPEKAQYKICDVKAFGGIDYATIIDDGSLKCQYIGEMMDYIDDQGVTSFCALMRWARKNRADWFRALCTDSTYVIREYIKSYTYESGLDD